MVLAPVPLTTSQVTPFQDKVGQPIAKQPISVLQINLGKRCNLACLHCHVEAGPNRTEELSPELCDRAIAIVRRFPQIETVDLTGGAPEMNYGFRPLVEAARETGKEVIVRSNLTVFYADGYGDLPEYFARHRLRVVASLPCYLQDNVDRMRGSGVFDESIAALQWLNRLGYGRDPELQIDLVYNPQLPIDDKFSLPPQQDNLERAYKEHLKAHFGIEFNQLFTIANLPVGRTQQVLERRKLHDSYLSFLETNFNPATVAGLMCRNQLSVDYRGRLYDCDFNQMADLPVQSADGRSLTLADLLAADSLDLIREVQTAPYCYGCTAGCGSSCGGALID